MLRLLALVLSLVAAAPALATSYQPHGKPTYVVDVPHHGALNLRSGPSTHYHVIEAMPDGAHVKLLGASGDWRKVSYDHVTGWAHADYLKPKTAKAPKKSKKKAIRDRLYAIHAPYDHFLNLRHGPGTHYHVITKMPHRTGVIVLGPRQGSWVKVKHPRTGRTGWAHSGYLKKI